MSAGIIIDMGNEYQVDFAYRKSIVDAIKLIPGRRFDYRDKKWLVPKESKEHLVRFAKINRFEFGMQASNKPQQYDTTPALPDLTIDIPLKRELFPFQKTGVAYALDKKRLIIGDQPGLGKTSQAFATIIAADAFPCLIICPSSLKINWQREIDQFTHKKAMILNDSVKTNFFMYHQAGLADFFIVNFESLKKYFVEKIDDPGKGKPLRLNHIHFKAWAVNFFKAVIIDESHRVKSMKAQQTKFTKGICTGKEWILALTGTPVINKPKDLIAQLGIIEQFKAFGGYSAFVSRYCSGLKEASNLKELNYKLNTTCFYRRDKSDVMKDLPPKTRQVVMCDISTRKEYMDAQRDLEEYLRKYKEATDEQIRKSMKGEVMVRIGILKNISARGKFKEVIEFIDDLIESGEKLVLFGHLKEVLGKFKEHYPDAVSITGEDSGAARQFAVDKFQTNPECKLIICSIQAAGVGLTLTASSRVAFVELGWHPAIHDQCEDRCHRIGQYDNVTCTYFLGKDTIDEWVYSIITEKRAMTNEVVGAVNDVEENVIDRVWTLFNQPK